MAGTMHKLTKNPSLLIKGVADYLQHCRSADKVPHTTGLAVWLDIHRQRLCDWQETYSADRWKDTPQAQIPDVLQKAKQACECGLVDKVLNSNKPVGAMFMLKCHHAYVEEAKVQQHNVTGSIAISVSTGVPKAAE